MAKQLTDKEKKLIIADYINCQNYSEVARKHGVSRNGVKKIINKDAESAELLQQKKEENTQDVFAYMDEQKETVKELLGNLLKGMNTKAKNLDMFTNIKDLATAYGIIFDKEFKCKEYKMNAPNNNPGEVDPLSQSLKELAGKLDDKQ